jgi:signal peptidase I
MPADPVPAGRPATPARAHRRRALLEWVLLIAGALLVAFVARQFVFQLFYIPSESMVPRLEVDDQVFVNKLAYDYGDPARGDVVVFTRPPDWGVDVPDLVKRVVGLPGETLEGRDGHVLVDGHPLSEPYLVPGTVTSDFGPVEVPAGRYFMMGDNRARSNDSRSFSPVDRDEFVGKVFMTVWPLDRISIPGWIVALVAGIAIAALLVWAVARRRDADAPPTAPPAPRDPV